MENPFQDLSVKLESIENSIGLLRGIVMKSLSSEPDLLTRQEVSKRLNVSLSTVDRLIKDQKLTKVKVGSKSLIPLSQIEEYIDFQLA